MPIQQALEAASSRGLDLVEVSPNADPPVCRIMDHGKFKFQQKKRQQEAKKRQSVIQMKEVKLRPKTEIHDIGVKVRNIVRFLNDGNRVKVTIVFRGREMAHTQIGMTLMNKILEMLEDKGNVEKPPKMEGRALVTYLAPTKTQG